MSHTQPHYRQNTEQRASSILNAVQKVFGSRVDSSQPTGVSRYFANFLEQLPINVMYADRDLVLRYMNNASRETLRRFEQYLPIR